MSEITKRMTIEERGAHAKKLEEEFDTLNEIIAASPNMSADHKAKLQAIAADKNDEAAQIRKFIVDNI